MKSLKKILLRTGSMLCIIYILNPLAGIDLLPDNLPVVGNLDEAFATMMLMTIEGYLRKKKGEKKLVNSEK
jgi:uncharacterized membrane protein YkvA (DUF1232 family)